MKPCTICGEPFDESDLEPSPSGSGKLMCSECADEVEMDLELMRLEAKNGEDNDDA